MVKYTILF